MNESRISAILGALVVIVVGVMVVNYFRNLNTGTTTPVATSTEQEQTQASEVKHTVVTGDSLWSIAEKHYDDGFKWTDIRDANDLQGKPIRVGQELIIPNVMAQASPTPLLTIKPSASPAPTPKPADETVSQTNSTDNTAKITGDNYTVEHGDNLWDIAVRAYGDGFQWTKIAQANNLVNPRVIHAGNQFVIPR